MQQERLHPKSTITWSANAVEEIASVSGNIVKVPILNDFINIPLFSYCLVSFGLVFRGDDFIFLSCGNKLAVFDIEVARNHFYLA